MPQTLSVSLAVWMDLYHDRYVEWLKAIFDGAALGQRKSPIMRLRDALGGYYLGFKKMVYDKDGRLVDGMYMTTDGTRVIGTEGEDARFMSMWTRVLVIFVASMLAVAVAMVFKGVWGVTPILVFGTLFVTITFVLMWVHVAMQDASVAASQNILMDGLTTAGLAFSAVGLNALVLNRTMSPAFTSTSAPDLPTPYSPVGVWAFGTVAQNGPDVPASSITFQSGAVHLHAAVVHGERFPAWVDATMSTAYGFRDTTVASRFDAWSWIIPKGATTWTPWVAGTPIDLQRTVILYGGVTGRTGYVFVRSTDETLVGWGTLNATFTGFVSDQAVYLNPLTGAYTSGLIGSLLALA